MKPALLPLAELTALLREHFPQIFVREGFRIDEVHYGGCRVRRIYHEDTLRPGGTISGPTQMELADFTIYVAVLASIGWQPLAVTTNLCMNFMRRPEKRDLIADCTLLKVGKRLTVGEVIIRSEGIEEPVSHATATYSIPGS